MAQELIFKGSIESDFKVPATVLPRIESSRKALEVYKIETFKSQVFCFFIRNI